ncbi:response regulator transcription factor [Salmonella enterica]|uniref:DNA-binding response regulator n=1 Tax=Salmonella enterica TaxID=28901 RepID=A0A3I6S0V2_SALER|nr:response regulator [Salmonella enterica]EBX0087349.1 DNA-binding response regulator [Salmonella enterica subsp. enterica serovar Miami]EBY3697927.1 DNA-binding response regulator [Salmonella enterica subsp. enterica serovar Muenchen]ECC8720528.1 DNA-binding response regulator [Salmonella enterica subsp. houtenae]ECH9522821.1 DNA-binding response regulator [Salmonella enterica subsp. enterica]ECT1737376.1 DNA-binding response regulator [Salmonella enterica subsp. enterica serovar Saintpaul]
MEQYIWLIDDDAAIRDSLALLLSTVGWQTQAFDSALSFQRRAGNLAELTGCMLLDIRMPGKSGLTLLDEWIQQGLTLPVIIMTGHGNIDLCRRAFKNGAVEFLTKPIDADLLFEVVGEAMTQQKARLEAQQKRLPLQEKLATLTARENEMLEQLIQGYSSKEIARLCSLSPRTVEAHRANIFSKLEVNSLPKLLKMYGDIAAGSK